MRNRRTLSWSTAMREVRGERSERAGIREERLRATAGLRNDPGLTSWRGWSGRRYVVGVHGPREAEVADATDAVVLAVQRDRDGAAALMGVVAPAALASRRSRLRWLVSMRTRGATEFHVHRLAETEAERSAMVRDLSGR